MNERISTLIISLLLVGICAGVYIGADENRQHYKDGAAYIGFLISIFGIVLGMV